MGLIDLFKYEDWKWVYDFERTTSSVNGLYVVCCEYTGTGMNIEKATITDRTDFLILVPVLVYDISNHTDKKKLTSSILKLGSRKYILKDMPTTHELLKNTNAVIKDNTLEIRLKSEGLDRTIKFPLTDKEKNVLENFESFSLALQDGEKNFIGRIRFTGIESNAPVFPRMKTSITDRNFPQVFSSIIGNISRLEKVYPSNLNNYLDIIGSSDYDVYQSTESAESLPSLSNLKLGNHCYVCGEEQVTREHCSPKWITDKYHVKPLIGKIFCKKCNSWFGENFEKTAKEQLVIGEFLSDKQRLFINKWCIKTAITMSIASGVAVNKNWLPCLRGNKIPDGFEVYFNPFMKLNENGFNYGVSRFNKKLAQNNLFLFSFASADFSFQVVYKDSRARALPKIPFYKFYPNYEKLKKLSNEESFADLHQRIHEFLADEKTIDYSLPIRNQ
ncbi:HNH endonuclease [Streptococcus sp. S784/96/1]|uniref:HNH endonuclease n=1 Tax=Streptococcus sp. S784/96/1 TaxID=2653499 RepID=UPI0013898F4E|nr:HNH endonuclease [Streptococcus sp. S784/96/1]